MFDYIYIAASNSTEELKAKSDFVCTGINDELTIQKAINACINEDKNIYLLNGIYNIGAFHDFQDNGPMSSICFPNAHREIKVIGQNHEYGFQRRYITQHRNYTLSAKRDSRDSHIIIAGPYR